MTIHAAIQLATIILLGLIVWRRCYHSRVVFVLLCLYWAAFMALGDMPNGLEFAAPLTWFLCFVLFGLYAQSRKHWLTTLSGLLVISTILDVAFVSLDGAMSQAAYWAGCNFLWYSTLFTFAVATPPEKRRKRPHYRLTQHENSIGYRRDIFRGRRGG